MPPYTDSTHYIHEKFQTKGGYGKKLSSESFPPIKSMSEIQILNFIQEHIRCGFLDAAMPVITHLGSKGILWIVTGLILAFFPKTRRAGLTLLAAVAINGIVCNLALKPIVARTRPFAISTDIKLLIKAPGDYSFPSGHTATACAMGFTALRELRKRYSIPIFIIGLLVSLSRLYLGMHYPTDVIIGILLGLFSCCLAERLMWRLQDKSLLKHLA